MDVKKYISSGVLELYLAGTLSEEENLEVYQNAMKHPEIKEEIWSIEAAILELSKSVFPEISPKKGFDDLKDRIGKSETLQLPKKKINWSIYGSLAATVLFALGLLWTYSSVLQLKSDINAIDQQNQVLHYQIADVRDSLVSSKALLDIMGGTAMQVVSLDGQEVSPTSTAQVYWDKEKVKIYIDAQGLPNPPDGFVYQVWSHTLDPFTPTSVGLLQDFLAVKHKIFVLDIPDIYASEAFGITLEPHRGSKTPTSGQLYALGAVSPSS